MLAALACVALSAGARGTIEAGGNTMNVDTIFHALVGPGTTQTQLRLTGNGGPLDVFYLTVDKTTPGLSFRTVCAQDKVAGNMTVRKMAETHSTGNSFYFAGVNGDFYATSGTATNGSSVIGTPTAATVVDREIYKTSNSNYQFSVDTEGIARVCRLNFYQGTAALGDKNTLFKGVNVGSPANGITLYTPRYWGSANQQGYAGSCHQVTAKLADGQHFYAGGEFDLIVTSEPATDGDMAVPADGFVIHGRGNSTTDCNTGADDFVAALRSGDVVHFNSRVLTPEGVAIQPTAVVSGNPKNVGGGVNLNSESERGDASSKHPRTMIGVSKDGNKIIMMVVDGRTGNSVGITTGMGADIMIYAGAHEAVNLDGGGSSTLYTSSLGVRNHCSDGSERAVGNAIFAVVDAPEDNEIASIAFRDWAMELPFYGVYTPVIYGFDRYGRMVTDDLKGFTLSGPAGEYSADGMTLSANVLGCHALTATYNGHTATIPVNVVVAADAMPKYADVLLNTTRSWTVEVQAKAAGTMTPVSAEPYDWSSSDASVATVDAHGTVTPVADGTCTITGTYGETTIPVNLTVQTATSAVMPVDAAHSADTWKVTGTGIASGLTSSVLDNGYAVDFQISSLRGTALKAAGAQTLFSLPEGLQMRVKPVGVTVKSMNVVVKAANNARTVKFTHSKALTTGEENIIRLPLKDIMDPEDIGIFPVTLNNMELMLTGATKTDYRLEVPGVEAYYDEATVNGVEDITVSDTDDNAPRRWYNLQGIPVANPTAPGLYVTGGAKMVIR